MSVFSVTVKRPPLRNPNSYFDIALYPKDYQRTIDTRKRRFLKAVGIETETALKDQAQPITKTGTLARNFQHVVATDLSKVRIFNPLEYSKIAMETGRKGGKMPPIQALQLWTKKVGLPAGAAFAIAKSIAKKGTQLYQFKAPKRLTRVNKLMKNYRIPRLIKTYLLNDI